MSLLNTTISSNDQDEINTINSFIISLARYIYPIIFLFGVVCNILNIYVFTRPTLKRNPCCMYFLSSSVSALVYTVINVPLRTLQMGYSIDPTAYIISICKLKFYTVYTYRAVAIWFLLLACFDRFLQSSSNVNRRQWSSFKVASRLITITCILGHLAYLHVIIFYEIILPRRICSIGSNIYSLFLGLWHLLTYGSGPPLLMLIFSLLTIRNIHHRRVVPITNNSNQMSIVSNKERNLSRMALMQCLVVGSTTTAYAISQWYLTFTSNQIKSNLQLAKDNLLSNLVGSISATGHSITFFIFTLTSKMFRQKLFRRE